MPTLYDYIQGFGWNEFWITFAIIALLVGIREHHHFFKKGPPHNPNLQSNE